MSNVINIKSYKSHKLNNNNNNLLLFNLTNSNTTTTTDVIKLYRINSSCYSLIKIKNNRIYRIIGPNLIENLIHNIPSNWVCISIFKGLTEGNIKALYNKLNKFNK